MLRGSFLLVLALTVALPDVAVPKDASAETRRQKRARKKKQAQKAAAAKKAAAKKAAAEKAAAEKAAAEKAAAEQAEAEAAAAAAAEAEAAAAAGAATKPPEEIPTPPPEPVEIAVASAWSQRVIDRPLNLLKGMVRFDAGLNIFKINTPAIPPATSGTSTTGVTLGVGFGFGIVDRLEAGVSYAISLKKFGAKGPAQLYGLFNIWRGETLHISAGAQGGYNLISKQASIGAGLAFQLLLTDDVMVYMPPTHLQIGLDPTTAVISLPIGIGIQATDNIFAAVETNVFDIGLKPSGTRSYISADRMPLNVQLSYYSPSNKTDLGVSVSASNLPDFADLFVVTAFARVYMGSEPQRSAAATETEPETTEPEPAATEPEPAATEPEPAATETDPAADMEPPAEE